ncbi:galactokinase galactose-binding signature / GHMP kinase, N-terminal domain multi-domain protein [Lachnoanaerobaculum saburreum F0468]|uniref:Galactokinase galactose-binding signature / GHMP kinase, N-terminal domain multi-domain protein n=1 Tax=Lachnoanaerobaculum saburreum F0468 TaxID=1095750 RepID=I0RBT4_9FIRM|nr:galactokinase family protein [Lachnoanaerobaculum saburreum]EIC97142.1 galactokinase galactose-binding signature / GHMP kinase, N-terminal domain multi-domain protein [Lachnoanaerobaculum saburreum F0468]
MNLLETKYALENKGQEILEKLYTKEGVKNNLKRYEDVLQGFVREFGKKDVKLFSSPGRTEISGNHTDHNNGKVLGGSINLDCIAAATYNDSNFVNIVSESFSQKFKIDINDIAPGIEKAGTTELLKGILAGFKERKADIGGFDAYITSNVISSAGVSSSAAFETLICQIINTLFNDGKLSKTDYAYIGKYAENHYWDKASGLLDQMCCAYGGLISIDFKNPDMPKVNEIDFDFGAAKHDLIIVQTGRGHADLSADYSSIPAEMKKVAEYFNKKTLSELDEKEFYNNLPKLREYAGDRAVLRSIHFFDENKRVENEVKALINNDFDTFLKNITDSGNSSWKYLQNVYTTAAPNEQGITVALALSERFLKEKNVGATRVHGGGFAGVIMAMVPEKYSDEYVAYMDKFLGEGSSYKMKIRPYGSVCLNDFI